MCHPSKATKYKNKSPIREDMTVNRVLNPFKFSEADCS